MVLEEKTYSREWERISGTTYRLPVPGGWLVKDLTQWLHGDKFFSLKVATWNVADETHDKWKIKEW